MQGFAELWLKKLRISLW